MAGILDFTFVEDGAVSIVIRSLKEHLINCGYKVGTCGVNQNGAGTIEMLPKFFVVDAELLLDESEYRRFLIDHCIKFNRKIILIGYKNTLQRLEDVCVTNIIAGSFERPLDNQRFLEKMKELVEEFDEKGGRKNLLVIDDSPTFLRLMSEWLENDYNVNVCPSASAAFHMIETNKPDLILLDYEMPICNGALFLEMLHSEPQTAGIPVIFLTSKDDAQTVKKLIALRPKGYLLKNQSKESILSAVAGFFSKGQMK